MKKYHTITIGCYMNQSDSERIANYLESAGYVYAADRTQADVVILTTCGVRQGAEDRIYGLIPDIKRHNKQAKIVLTGCLSGRADVQERLKESVDVWLPITELSSLSEKLGDVSEIIDQGSISGYLSLRPKYQSTFSALIPIGNGCNNFCSYCVVPHARGREKYRDAAEIIAEAEALAKRGYKEIILIAQNVNSYASTYQGQPINFPQLLERVHDVPGNFWLRFSTNHPKDMSDELIDVIARCPKICRHMHLPVQAGDDQMLAAMNRKYTVAHYRNLVAKVREKLDKNFSSEWHYLTAISTDVIVGYPGEIEEQFEHTAQLFRDMKYDMAYISQYSARPNTAAEKLVDNVPAAEKKRREEVLDSILSETALENNRVYLNQVVEVLVDEKIRDCYYGKTRTSKTVKIITPSEQSLIGQFVNIKITVVKNFGLEGEIVDLK